MIRIIYEWGRYIEANQVTPMDQTCRYRHRRWWKLGRAWTSPSCSGSEEWAPHLLGGNESLGGEWIAGCPWLSLKNYAYCGLCKEGRREEERGRRIEIFGWKGVTPLYGCRNLSCCGSEVRMKRKQSVVLEAHVWLYCIMPCQLEEGRRPIISSRLVSSLIYRMRLTLWHHHSTCPSGFGRIGIRLPTLTPNALVHRNIQTASLANKMDRIQLNNPNQSFFQGFSLISFYF